jgi:chorismate dehydratase
LRRFRPEAGSFQLRQRGLEDIGDATTVGDKLSRTRGSERRGQRERQPIVSAEVHENALVSMVGPSIDTAKGICPEFVTRPSGLLESEAMPRPRVSAISFLNTAPLMWDFDHGELRQKYQVDYTLPSACAELLRQGMADIGIIPVAAYASIPDLRVIPNVAIAAKGAVKSILLVSKVPLERIRTVAADTSSRSSVALLQVLFAKFYGESPAFVPMEPKLKVMLQACDAALVIGDPALLANTEGYEVRDLAAEWLRLTGKPFVFAFWAVRAGLESKAMIQDFQQSRDHGLEPANLQKLAREWSVRLSLPSGEIVFYLRDNIFYYLDEDCLSGLNQFYDYATQVGALGRVPTVRFIE